MTASFQPKSSIEMPDIQKTTPVHQIDLMLVGVNEVKFTTNLVLPGVGKTHFTGTLAAFTNLDRDQRGTHMSRLILTPPEPHLDTTSIVGIVDQMAQTVCSEVGSKGATNIKYILRGTFLVPATSPVTKVTRGYTAYDLGIEATRKSLHDENIFSMSIEVGGNVMTLCPCSKAISESSAHNQRALVVACVAVSNADDARKLCLGNVVASLVNIINSSASSPLYPFVKRADEKYVTESSYNNPMFVEDVARNVLSKIKERFHIPFGVGGAVVESHESIHQHNAVARGSVDLG